jgi:hypothetical protein
MRTNELLSAILSCELLSPYSGGVHAADHLPTHFPSNSFFIANSDILANPGKHWVCFYKSFQDNYTCIEFFDSAGFGPEKYRNQWISYLKNQSDYYIYNRKIIQHPLSTYCGIHCLYFALLRVQDVKFNNIIHAKYTDDLCYNDQIAKSYVSQHINTDILRRNKSLQSCKDVFHYFI